MARSASSCRPLGHPAALDPAEEAGDVGDAGRVERGMHLDVEVVAELQTPEEFENRCVAQHDRGVALLPGEQPWLKVGAEAAARAVVLNRVSLSGLRSRRPPNSARRITRHASGSWAASYAMTGPRSGSVNSADLGVVQLGVRGRTVGDRKLVVLGGRGGNLVCHLGCADRGQIPA